MNMAGFNQFNRKTRRTITTCLILIGSLILLWSYFIGADLENKNEVAAEGERTRKTDESEQSPSELAQEERYEFEDPAADKKELGSNGSSSSLSTFFPRQEITDSREAAQEFIESFYPFDGNEPMKGIEESRPLMIEGLYRLYTISPLRPTPEIYQRKLVTMEIMEPTEPPKEYLAWKVLVKGAVSDMAGNTKEEKVWFLLKMQKSEGKYKVSDLAVNKPD
jgi:hypothetical protein